MIGWAKKISKWIGSELDGYFTGYGLDAYAI